MSEKIINFLVSGKKTWREICDYIGDPDSLVTSQLKNLFDWGLIEHEISDQIYYIYTPGGHND